MKPILLIAEGNDLLRDNCQRFLSEFGYQVQTASNGLDCLVKLQRVAPAAVVLDLELCWGADVGVLTWLSQDRTSPGIPVVLTAATAELPALVRDIKRPGVSFLNKPYSLTAL